MNDIMERKFGSHQLRFVYISSEEINNRSTILCHLVVMADEEALLPNLYPYSDDSDVDEDFDYSRRS